MMMSISVLLLALSIGAHDQSSLAAQVVRLHVLANSDTEADQSLKEQVRDAVLAKAEPILAGASHRTEAEVLLSAHLGELNQAALRVIREEGYDYSVRTSLTTGYFPTRRYTDFSLPAGEYQALRVEIGAAKGHNWWCVVYPPLCAMDMEEVEAASFDLGEDQIRLVTQSSPEYVVRFRCAQWWSQLRALLTADETAATDESPAPRG